MSDAFTLDTERVSTGVGEYVIEWIRDIDAEQPYDGGFSLIAGADYRGHHAVDTTNNAVPHEVVRALDNHNRWPREHRSGAAIVRYLTLMGKNGVTLVTEDFRVDTPTTDRFDRVYGVAWAPDDVPAEKSLDCVKSNLAQWAAWADGDVFGYTVTAPGGDEIEACWGFYGFTDYNRQYTRQDAIEAINEDVEQRTAAANRVGAGFVGII